MFHSCVQVTFNGDLFFPESVSHSVYSIHQAQEGRHHNNVSESKYQSRFHSKMKTLHWYISGLFIALLYIYLLAVQYVRGVSSNIDFNYHNHDELTAILNNLNQQYPDLTALYSVGKSVEGIEKHISSPPFSLCLSISLFLFFFHSESLSIQCICNTPPSLPVAIFSYFANLDPLTTKLTVCP